MRFQQSWVATCGSTLARPTLLPASSAFTPSSNSNLVFVSAALLRCRPVVREQGVRYTAGDAQVRGGDLRIGDPLQRLRSRLLCSQLHLQVLMLPIRAIVLKWRVSSP